MAMIGTHVGVEGVLLPLFSQVADWGLPSLAKQLHHFIPMPKDMIDF